MTPTGSLITLRCIPSGPISSVCPVHFSASLVCLLLQVMIHFLRLCYKVTGPRRPGSRLNKKKKTSAKKALRPFPYPLSLGLFSPLSSGSTFSLSFLLMTLHLQKSLLLPFTSLASFSTPNLIPVYKTIHTLCPGCLLLVNVQDRILGEMELSLSPGHSKELVHTLVPQELMK